MKLFGYHLVKESDYKQLHYSHWLLERCREHMHWPHQRFVRAFLKGFIEDDDISIVRDRFERALDRYVKAGGVEDRT